MNWSARPIVRPAPARAFALLLGATAALAACGDDPIRPATRPAGSLEVVGGEGQSAEVGSVLPSGPEVLVRDSAGNPLAGALVTFTARTGRIASTNVRTNASGRANAGTWTLGERSGLDTIVVTVPGVAPRIVTARARAGAPVSLALTNPSGFQGRVFEQMDLPVFRVLDKFGNGVPGVAMSLQVLNLDGTMPTSRLTPPTELTDDFGIVGATSWLPYVVGEHRVRASILDGFLTALAVRRTREDACGARRVVGPGAAQTFTLDATTKYPGCADTLDVITVVTTVRATIEVQADRRGTSPDDPADVRSAWLTRAPAWTVNPQVVRAPDPAAQISRFSVVVLPGNYDIRVAMPRAVASRGSSVFVRVTPTPVLAAQR